jgi:hypothetical protein
LVVEDPAEMIPIGKHFGLMRQIGAAGIDQIEAGQPILARDLLRSQMLFHRHRIIGAAFDGRVIADDDAFTPGDPADAGDQAGAMNGVLVHLVRRQRRQFQERRPGIDQRHHALPRQEFAAGEMPLTCARRTTFGGLGAPAFKFRDQLPHGRLIGAEFLRLAVDLGGDCGH